MEERIPYDIEEARMTDGCLGAILRAAIVTDSHVLDSFAFPGEYKNPNMTPVVLRVLIPSGREAEFEAIAKVELRMPPRVEGM